MQLTQLITLLEDIESQFPPFKIPEVVVLRPQGVHPDPIIVAGEPTFVIDSIYAYGNQVVIRLK